jgi:membrane protease YdiL (CAAX protease family)
MFLNIKKTTLGQWQETFLSFLVAIFCLSLVYFFPADDFLQNLTKHIFFLITIPWLYVKLVLQKDIRDFGINLDQKKTGLIWGGLLLLFLTVLFFFIIRYTEFEQVYSPPALIETSFGYFLIYELVLINLLFLSQEIFLKGFLLSALREKLGHWSILIQSTVFLFPLFIDSSYFMQLLPMIALSLTGGWVAYRSRTFIFSYLAGLIFLILLDAYIIFINK